MANNDDDDWTFSFADGARCDSVAFPLPSLPEPKPRLKGASAALSVVQSTPERPSSGCDESGVPSVPSNPFTKAAFAAALRPRKLQPAAFKPKISAPGRTKSTISQQHKNDPLRAAFSKQIAKAQAEPHLKKQAKTPVVPAQNFFSKYDKVRKPASASISKLPAPRLRSPMLRHRVEVEAEASADQTFPSTNAAGHDAQADLLLPVDERPEPPKTPVFSPALEPNSTVYSSPTIYEGTSSSLRPILEQQDVASSPVDVHVFPPAFQPELELDANDFENDPDFAQLYSSPARVYLNAEVHRPAASAFDFGTNATSRWAAPLIDSPAPGLAANDGSASQPWSTLRLPPPPSRVTTAAIPKPAPRRSPAGHLPGLGPTSAVSRVSQDRRLKAFEPPVPLSQWRASRK